MSAAKVLLETLERGIAVHAVDGRIRCRHAAGALSPGLEARVREQREEFLALLADRDGLRVVMATAIFDAEPVNGVGAEDARQLNLLPAGDTR